MAVIRHDYPVMHQCPGCFGTGFFRVPEGGWIECDCGEAMTVIDLRATNYRGAVEDRDKLAAYLRWRRTPFGPAPMTMEERDALLDRLGGSSGP